MPRRDACQQRSATPRESRCASELDDAAFTRQQQRMRYDADARRSAML